MSIQYTGPKVNVKRVIEPLTPERRREQTREHLLAAAAQVFGEKGFRGATLDDVASVAGFTKGAVYSNFKSKDDLFLALLESRYAAEMANLRERLGDGSGTPHRAADFLAHLTADLEQTSAGDWGRLYMEFVVYALRSPAAREQLVALERADITDLAALLSAERERHGISDVHSVDHAARFVVALMRGLWIMRLIDPGAVDEDVVAAVLDFLERALTGHQT